MISYWKRGHKVTRDAVREEPEKRSLIRGTLDWGMQCVPDLVQLLHWCWWTYDSPVLATLSDDSHHFVGLNEDLPPGSVCRVLGNFLPQNPSIFYVAWGQVTHTPFLYLPAFHLAVTRGPLLHHEQNFSYYQAHTIVYVDGRLEFPVLTLMIPHHLGIPEAFQPSPQMHQNNHLALFSDHVLPQVEICPHRFRIWQRERVELGPATVIQDATFTRLHNSWWSRRGLRAEVDGKK